MTIIQRLFWANLLVGVGALAAGYAITGHLVLTLVFVILGAIWFMSQQRVEHGLGGLMLSVYCLAGGLGIWFNAPGWLMLIALVAVLGAWDLDNFLQRLGVAERVEFDTGLGREHLRRLAMVEGLGFLAGLIALTAQIHIPFWWVALLVFLAVIGISRIVAYVRKQTEE